MGAGSERPAATKGGVELAEIFRAYGESYRRHHRLPVSHLKVMQAVERCRTAAGAPLWFFSQPLQRLSVEVSSTHRPYARTASTSPTLHRGVDAGLDGNRYPSLPALPEGNAGVGFSAGGVSAVGFIVKIGAFNQNVGPSVAPCRSQRIAMSGCIVLLAFSLRCMVLEYLLETCNCNSEHHLFRLLTPRHYQLTSPSLLQSP